MPAPHDFTPDADGDCAACPLPKTHPTHTATTTTTAPRLAAVPDLGVSLTPNQAATSQAAAHVAWPRAGTKRAAVLEAVAATGDYGATDDDLAFDLDLPGNTVRPRRGELVTAGWITQARDADGRPITRPSEQGNDAAVWVLTDAAKQHVAA